MSNAHEFSVSQISRAVKSSIEEQFGHVRVRGEVGRISRPGSGHIYFDLKDDKAVLAAVAWRGVVSRWRFQPEQGLEVIVTGKLTTFPGQSKYQIIVENVEPAGVGALMALLEERRKKLDSEGIFDEDKKRSLPFLPGVIGVVTSPSGAVIRDILHRLKERFPTRVIVWPVRVQGPSSAKEVAAAIRGFNTLPSDGNIARPDLIIVARGGGSIEDLWSFNEEEVVRAIFESSIPLISAIGHETDVSLSDFAADKRAPTPTAAAEIAVPVRAELIGYINDLTGRKYTGVLRNISSLRDRLRAVGSGLSSACDLIAQSRQRLDLAITRLGAALDGARQKKAICLARIAPRLSALLLANLLEERRKKILVVSRRSAVAIFNKTRNSRLQLTPVANRLRPAMALKIKEQGQRLKQSFQLLHSLGYRNVLERGFVLVVGENHQVVKRGKDLKSGDNVILRFADSDKGAIIENAGSKGPGSGAGKSKKLPPGSKSSKIRGKPDDGQTSLF